MIVGISSSRWFLVKYPMRDPDMPNQPGIEWYHRWGEVGFETSFPRRRTRSFGWKIASNLGGFKCNFLVFWLWRVNGVDIQILRAYLQWLPIFRGWPLAGEVPNTWGTVHRPRMYSQRSKPVYQRNVHKNRNDLLRLAENCVLSLGSPRTRRPAEIERNLFLCWRTSKPLFE